MADRVRDEEHVTEEVGSEGGSAGDVEIEQVEGPLKGREKTSTIASKHTRLVEHRHDETGEGRRNP